MGLKLKKKYGEKITGKKVEGWQVWMDEQMKPRKKHGQSNRRDCYTTIDGKVVGRCLGKI